jgi:two-component system nitrogen regulation sensor histidine kinase NtrY
VNALPDSLDSKDALEARRRRRERWLGLGLLVLLVTLTAVEIQLSRLSAELPFVNSIFFFGLMNLNVVLIMLLLFLVFRNVVKVLVEDRRGGAGGRLRTRLVFSFILFAIIPTVLLFTVSALYIRSSFDKWFSVRVGAAMQHAIEVVRSYYDNAQQDGTHFARKIAFQIEAAEKRPEVLQKLLSDARLHFRLDGVEYYPDAFATPIVAAEPGKEDRVPRASLESLERAVSGVSECRIQHVGTGDLVRCGAAMAGGGVVFANTFIPVTLSEGLSKVSLTFRDFTSENPLNSPMKSTYLAILTMVTLLILFAAVWTGFHVAKRLTVPLEELLKGTEAVAQGNLGYRVTPRGGYELHRLVASFNQMTGELEQHKRDIEAAYSQLERRNRYIEMLLGNVRSGVVSLDREGRITTANPAALRMLRVEAAQILGKPYAVVVPESHRAEIRELLEQVNDDSVVHRELRLRSAGGTFMAVLVTVGALRNELNERVGTVAVLDDVTDLQKVERMLAWQEVARRLAHEIKNPLTPIQLSVQRLQRRYSEKLRDDGTFQEATEIILSEVDSLKTLVDEFSSFARLPQTRLETGDLNAVVMEAVSLFRAAHEALDFALELDEDVAPVALDRAAMKRVLVNLFDNALAAMNGGGRISLVTSRSKDGLGTRLVVADEGCGISSDVADRLFEPYFSTKEGGTGLGLAIVQRIVSEHGATVRFAENTPRGTRVTIDFPPLRPKASPRPEPSLATRPEEGPVHDA